jgi:hypothetical protein
VFEGGENMLVDHISEGQFNYFGPHKEA